MNFWKTNEFQKVNGELINSVIDTVTGDSDVDDKVMLVTNFLVTFDAVKNYVDYVLNTKNRSSTFETCHQNISSPASICLQ